MVAFVQSLRKEDLFKSPGVAETLDWASALLELGAKSLDPALRRRHARRRAQISGRHRPPRQDQDRSAPPRKPRAIEAGGMNAAPAVAENIIAFARAFRAAGLKLGPGSAVDAVEAVETAGFSTRADFYWTLHAVFVTRHEQSPSSIRPSASSGAGAP